MKHKRTLLYIVAAGLLAACHPSVRKQVVIPAPQIRVLLSAVVAKDSVTFSGDYILKTAEAKFVFGKKNRKIFIVPFKKGYRVFNQNRYLTFSPEDVVYFEPRRPESTFRFQNRSYAGRLVLGLNNDASLLVINKLDVESYLRGVVPAEMPSEDKDNFEAVKAQAVCARTYAVRRMNLRKDQLFDVYSDTRDQVYAGQQAARHLADQAIEQTRGSVLMFGDSLAHVYYHSTCGGVTEAGNEVFADRPVPYLPSAEDQVGNAFACRISPKFRWLRRFTLPRIDSLFRQNKNYSLLNRPVTDTTEIRFNVQVLERSVSHRVKKLRVDYGDSSLVLTGYRIRDFFRDESNRALPSTLFYVKARGDSVLYFRGGGYGHGVGLCQWGAIGLARKGVKFYDILIHRYFPGTYLKRMY